MTGICQKVLGAQVQGGGFGRVGLQPCRLTEDMFNDGLSMVVMGISRLARSGDLGIFVVDKSVSAASSLMINFDKL